MKKLILILSILFSISIASNATTWFPAEHTCPICEHKDDYEEIGSYGSYIYQWESKYQYIYWPLTDSPTVYSCIKCHFSTYMWDFDSVPENKVDTLKGYLNTVEINKKYKDYMDIPMTTRLEIAEGVYEILERDNEFWCQFYRLLGLHYDSSNKAKKAKESRLKALEIARNMLTDSLYTGQEKENYYIIAAMHNFTEQPDSALFYLEKASLLTYENKNIGEESAEGLDEYLSDLIIQYKELIKGEDE